MDSVTKTSLPELGGGRLMDSSIASRRLMTGTDPTCLSYRGPTRRLQGIARDMGMQRAPRSRTSLAGVAPLKTGEHVRVPPPPPSVFPRTSARERDGHTDERGFHDSATRPYRGGATASVGSGSHRRAGRS